MGCCFFEMFGLLIKILQLCALVVYKTLRAFRIHFTVLLLLVGIGLLLFDIDIMTPKSPWFLGFWTGVGLTVLYAVFSFANQFNFLKKRENKNKAVEIIQPETPAQQQTVIQYVQLPAQPPAETPLNETSPPAETPPIVAQPVAEPAPKQGKKTEKPKYYAVKENPDYVVAEYEDRNELYYRTKDGLKHIRTDYKKDL